MGVMNFRRMGFLPSLAGRPHVDRDPAGGLSGEGQGFSRFPRRRFLEHREQ
jgi:hypothetical protein